MRNEHMRYLGTVGLLASLSQSYGSELEQEDMDLIEQAIDDCVADNPTGLKKVRCRQGWELEVIFEGDDE